MQNFLVSKSKHNGLEEPAAQVPAAVISLTQPNIPHQLPSLLLFCLTGHVPASFEDMKTTLLWDVTTCSLAKKNSPTFWRNLLH
jgi:hypothetical protein